MPTYEEVLNLAERLKLADRLRLLQALSATVYAEVEVEGSDEVVPAAEIAESELAWQAYQAGKDPGISATDLKEQLFGKPLAIHSLKACPKVLREDANP